MFLLLQANPVQSAPFATEISIGDAALVEADTGTSLMTFTISRTGDTTGPSTVDVDSVDITALAGDDFTALNETVVFAIGEEAKTVSVEIIGETLVELNESFALVLSNPTGATLGTAFSGMGSIVDNDKSEVSISAASSAEENSGEVTFEVVMTNPVDADIEIDIATSPDTANSTATDDYTEIATTLTFTSGETSKEVTVSISDDTILEDDETFEIEISNLDDAGRLVGLSAADTGIGTILNDDSAKFSISSSSETAESGTREYIVELDGDIQGGATISYTVVDGTTSAADYSPGSGTIIFDGDSGETQTISIDIANDTDVEIDETFELKLGVLSAPGTAADITLPIPLEESIVDDDSATIQLLGDPDGLIQNEDQGPDSDVPSSFQFTVQVDNAVEGGFTVPILISRQSGSDELGIDYTVNKTSLIFAGNEDEEQTFTVFSVVDSIVEPDESFEVTLGDPVPTFGGAITKDGIPKIFTIKNDDIAKIDIDAVPSQAEGTGVAGTSTDYLFNVSVDKAVEGGFNVSYKTIDGTAIAADGDYAHVESEVEFEGTLNEVQQIAVKIAADKIVELDEQFEVKLSTIQDEANNNLSSRIEFFDDDQDGKIINDDKARISLSFEGLTYDETNQLVKVNEGDSGSQTYTVKVTLLEDVQDGFSIDYSLAGGTAAAGSDYESNSGTLDFIGNGTLLEERSFEIVVNGDTSEEQNENFLVALENFTNTNIPEEDFIFLRNPTTFEITNDDGTIINISAESETVLEGDTDVVFTVELDDSSFETITVDYEVKGISATPNSDFGAQTGTLTFEANETVKNISVSILDDLLSEDDETLVVEISNPTNATVGSSSEAILTIVDNDGLPSISFGAMESTVSESDVSIPVTVTLNRVSSRPISVTISTHAGTATATDDFETLSQVVVFPAGTLIQTVLIKPVDDSLYEHNETFSLSMSDFVNGDPGTTTEATITIEDNDVAPLISISDVTANESDELATMSFEVSLSKVAGVDISVSFATQDGSAKADDGDYQTAAGRVVIPAGDLSQSIDISINGDQKGEGDEYFEVILSAPSDGEINPIAGANIGTGTLRNDDVFQVYQPRLTNGRINAPDLVPTSIEVVDGRLSITFYNNGPRAVENAFWVDLFVDPTVLPTKPNHTIDTLTELGLVWLISGDILPIPPRSSVTISYGDAYFRPAESNFSGNIPAGTLVVVHIDSGATADYAAINETHEQNNGIYNNILTVTTTDDVVIR